MENKYVNLTIENINDEHICCAIGDKKHQTGVIEKKRWISEKFSEGHVFRKLDERGKVFIEYEPLENAWVPIDGKNYLYIYCLWVSGSFSGKGIGKELIEYCISDAKSKNKSGICAISSKKKKPFLADKKFLLKYGFEVVDTIGEEYELLALSFDGEIPRFNDEARKLKTNKNDLTIYYGLECPYIPNCIKEVKEFCEENNIRLDLIKVDSKEKAKKVPGVFNNWAVFNNGKFETVHLLNVGYLKKLLMIK